MKDARAICLFCRSRLAASAARRQQQSPPWAERAKPYTTSATAQGAPTNPSESQTAVRHSDRDSDALDPVVYKRKDQLRATQNAGKGQRFTKIRGARSLEIFEEVLHKQKEGTGTEQWQPKVGMVVYQHLAKLGETRKEYQDLGRPDGFNYFREHIYPELIQHNIRDLPAMFLRTARYCLNDAAAGKAKDYTSSAWPTVAEITLMRRRLNLMEKPEHWTPLVVGLVDSIRSISANPDDYPSLEGYESLQATRHALLKDLIAAWRMFCLPSALLTKKEVTSNPSQFRLPEINPMMLDAATKEGNVALGLATIFTRYTPHNLQSLPRAAIPTFALLTDPVQCEDAIRGHAKDFLAMMGRVFARFPLQEQRMRQILGVDDTLFEYVWRRWQALKQASETHNQAKETLYLPQARYDTRSAKDTKSDDALAVVVYQRLSQAFQTRDPQACEKVWTTFWGKEEVPSTARAARLRGMEEEFNFFVMVFTTMRKPGRAIEILGSMAQIGLAPSLKTWTSFIEGCKRASNVTAIHDIWGRLVASGIELDVKIWTARISGLIGAGDPDSGLRALNEMQKNWAEAVRSGKPETAVRPTIEPVNAAIAGLLRLRNSSAAQQVLKWAGKYDIAPDVITYNTLLQPLVRQGHSAEITNLLKVMNDQNVQADVATFTILMDGALAQLDGTDSAARVATIESILQQMQSAGIKPNHQTYAKMIYHLLQEGEGDEDSVKVLLKHIWATGNQLSPHIYTMLAEHYFSRDPPDLASVGMLMKHYSNLHDRVFWERTVRGFAQAGDTENALECFKRIENSVSVTTSTLEVLLQALINNDEWDEARALARKAKSQREASAASDPRVWRNRFWHLVVTHDLLEADEVSEIAASQNRGV